MSKRNIYLLGAFATDLGGDGQQYQEGAFFYANKVYITVEEEEIRGEKKMITGEIRVRWKKRRKIELELPFFDKFNQFENEMSPGYREFETIINSPILGFRYIGVLKSELNPVGNIDPYYSPDLFPMGYSGSSRTVEVYLKEKKVEYLDDLTDKKIIRLTFMEKKSWYDTGQEG